MSKLPDEFYDPFFVPTKDQFVKHFMSINLNGDPDAGYDVMLEVLNEATSTPENKNINVSFGYLIDKYNTYLAWWDSKFSNKDEKYISKLDKKKTPGEFVLYKQHLRLYSIERASRDNYIFSKLSFSVLHKKLEIFNKLIFGEDYVSENVEEDDIVESVESISIDIKPKINDNKPKMNNEGTPLVTDDTPF